MANVPGSNILNQALTVIRRQSVQYFQYDGRSLNAVGQYVSDFEQVVTITGSWQPIPQNLYTQLGLDLQKEYFNFYASHDILDLKRDVSGDRIIFDGMLYQCQSNTEWYAIDGWKAILCVKIGAV